MAEIPIEHKSSKSWLWVLLALLVLGLLAWWLLDNDGNDVVEYTDTETDAVAAAPAVTSNTSASAGTAAVGTAALAAGQTINLQNLRVTSLAGDMAFNAEVNGEPMLIVFNQQPTPNTAKEGKFDINPGSVINISGSVRSASDPLPSGVSAQIPAGTDRYIFADTIEMVS